MIIGTAGHIDHGKTTLVRALTGVDTDRLKEEKARGISIELGYAYLPVPAGGDAGAEDPAEVLGFIDVPGHEKFVHTMAAGAAGIDHALLVVAADDGVMPQTREHLAIVKLFGITQGTVALTKCDRADAARIAAVRAEIAALLAATPLAGAPIFETRLVPLPSGERLGEGQHDTTLDTASSTGIEALRQHLLTLARQHRARRHDGLFRLAIDRVFTLAGHGTVVTGTVFGGQVRAGDSLTHSATGQPVRVRSLHAQNRAAAQGAAGQRVALNLAGIDKDAIRRGDWIADARLLQPTQRIDVRAQLLADAPAQGQWAALHVHLGAAHLTAHLVPLQSDSLQPGAEARVQLVLDEPAHVLPGDRLILRNAQGNRTLGGAVVLDPFAPERKRRSPARMAWLDALDALVQGGDAAPLIAQAPHGLRRSALIRLTGRLPPAAIGEGDVQLHEGEGGDALLLAQSRWQPLRERVLAALERHHARASDEPGLNSARLRRVALPDLLKPEHDLLWHALHSQLLAEGAIVRSGPWLHLPGHSTALSDAERALSQQLLPLMHAGRYDPPWVRDLARARQLPEERVRELLRRMARAGDLFQVVKDLFYPAATLAELAELVAQLGSEQPGGIVEARHFRDATQLGRKRAIQLLEYFDRVGYTRRIRDAHVVRPGTRWTAEGPVAAP